MCLQVKPLPDDNKYGWTTEQLWNDLPLLQELHYLSVRGLMVILPLGLSQEETLSTFKSLKVLQEKLKIRVIFQIILINYLWECQKTIYMRSRLELL